jgi:hypothetical protein
MENPHGPYTLNRQFVPNLPVHLFMSSPFPDVEHLATGKIGEESDLGQNVE